MKKYLKQSDPTIIPTGNDKLIEEHFGNASLKYEGCSIARMEVPPKWKEPIQQPEFDEFIMVTRGKMVVNIEKEKILLRTGESLMVKKGFKVRYTNPHDEHAAYWSICLPPFSLDTVHRQ